jgi:DNA-binding NtrC family response regulator
MISTIEQFKGINIMRKTLTDDLANYGITSPLVTRNNKMLSMLRSIPQVAATNASILITGESGTGKEILCQMIHDSSPRSEKPLVKLNCAAIAPTMVESELFGVARNVATGVNSREGKFEAADGGTFFLDEIGDMQLDVQARLLRVVEHQGFERVGSNRTIYADVRLIYASNKDLADMVNQGKFRQDLFYRINTIVIEVPPLRERPEDIEPLISHFSRIFSPYSGRAPRFSGAAMEYLMAYHWPGNVRELRNLVERMCILHADRVIGPDDLPAGIRQEGASVFSTKASREAREQSRMRESLIINDWNQSAAAAALDMPLTTFRRKIKRYGITRSL